jgi:transposase
MAGAPGEKMIDAMELVLGGMSRHAAAQRVGVGLNTMYRSKLNKMWGDGLHDELRAEIARRREALARAKKAKAGKKINRKTKAPRVGQ